MTENEKKIMERITKLENKIDLKFEKLKKRFSDMYRNIDAQKSLIYQLNNSFEKRIFENINILINNFIKELEIIEKYLGVKNAE